MADEADSQTPDPVGPLAQKPNSPPRTQRTHALYHFLERVDVIIKRRCALLLDRQTGHKAACDKPQRQEMQEPQYFSLAITSRGDDELTNPGPDEAPKRGTPSGD